MYTVAMEGMVVTSTGLQGKDDKKELQTKIERMGGVYSNNFQVKSNFKKSTFRLRAYLREDYD